MINNINGASICYAMIIFLGVYILVLINVFRNEMGIIIFSKEKSYSTGKTEKQLSAELNLTSKIEPSVLSSKGWLYNQSNEQKFFHAEQSLIKEINTFFKTTSISDERKEAVINSLHQTLNKYPSIKNTAYSHAALNGREVTCDTISSIHLNDENEHVVVR